MNNHIQLVLKSSTTEMSLNDHESGIYIVPELEGLTGLPEIRTTSGVNSGYDGGWTSAQNFDARSITIRGVIANTDVAAVERMRKQLVALLAQGKNETLTLNLVTEAGNSYDIEVRTIACEMAMQTVLQQQEFLIQLRADDPLIYDSSAGGGSALVQVQHAIGGFEINFELPLAISGGEGESVIQNNGLEQVYPIIKMYGALHRPTFVNLTTNQQIQLDTTLAFAEGDWFNPSETYTGKTIYLEDAPDNAPLASFQLDGETSQNGTPTPDAPVAVQTVTGENVVKICGKNLWGGTIELGGIGIQTGNNDGATDRVRTKEYVSVEASTEYAISGIYGSRYALFYDANKSFLGYALVTNRATQGSFTTVQNTRYIRWYVIPIGTSPDTSIKEQLELGSTATAYEPYQGQSYEVNLGKNLFDKDNANIFNGYLGASGIVEAANARAVYIPVVAGQTYTFSRANSTSQVNDPYYAFIANEPAGGGQYIEGRHAVGRNDLTFTGTAPAGSKYLIFYFAWNPSAEAQATILSTYQLELGSTPTSYAAYFEPIELCKIGTYQDYIWKDGDTWKVHKACDIITLDSTSSVNCNHNNNTFQFYFSRIEHTSQYSVALCNYAPYWRNKWNELGSFISYNGNPYILIPDTEYGFNADMTVSEAISTLRSMLASLPLVFYYQMKAGHNSSTPYYTDTAITNTALIEQLDAILSNAKTYAGINNIFTVTPNEQGTLEISYYTDKEADRRDVVIIDSRMRTVTLNGIDIYHLIEEGSEFPMLDPGENKLVLRSDIPGDNGYAEINYKQGYLSI